MIKKKNIAIIPARGGSKRIPRKNIKEFLGEPIIAYSIKAAVESGLFDEVMVSTDDKEIAEIAKANGAQVPFYRAEATANDYATLVEVVEEVLAQYRAEGVVFDNVCCLLATAPFVSATDLISCYEKLSQNHLDSAFPVVRYSFPIQRAMKFEEGYIKMVWPENMNKRSQDLEPTFHDAGLFYWVTSDAVLKQRRLWTDKTSAYEIDESKAQDIDTNEDWKMAELKFKLLYD